MRLAHLHLAKPITYTHSLRLQEALLERNFLYSNQVLQNKKTAGTATTVSFDNSTKSAPVPTLLTFQTLPTYTVGRRHLKANPLSQAQIDFLTTDVSDQSFEPSTSASSSSSSSSSSSTKESPSTEAHHERTTRRKGQLATFYASPRGGLLTYHAPGQLTAYLIYNLRHYGITPRCHIRLLEKAVIRTCAQHGVQHTMTTDDPGVWIGTPQPPSNVVDHYRNEELSLTPTDRKICAIGVHVSRGSTSHGLGLNIFDSPIPEESDLSSTTIFPSTSSSPSSLFDTGEQVLNSITQPGEIPDSSPSTTSSSPSSFLPHNDPTANDAQKQKEKKKKNNPGYLSWGFNRIVACGLEGKSVTWLTREQSQAPPASSSVSSASITTTAEHNNDPISAGAETETGTALLTQVSHTLAREIARGLTNLGKIKIDVENIDHIREEDILS